MSDYYDITKPYSIDNWNLLIKDVNEILENPPEGSDCEPIDPIEEVKDPHRWSVEDIEVMRDKLIETCPDIEFEKELKLWKFEVIDEIVEEMEKAWCNCQSGPIDISVYYYVSPSSVEASPDPRYCCGATVQSGHGVLCGTDPYMETIYTSPLFSLHSCTNDPIIAAAREQSNEAWTKTRFYVDTWNSMILTAEDISQTQGYLDTQVARIDLAISDLEDCLLANPEDPSVCDPLKLRICEYGDKAKEYQDKINDWIDDFNTIEPELEPAKEAADTAAQANFNLMATLVPHYDLPGNENMVPILAPYFTGLRWDNLIEPKIGYHVDYVSKFYTVPGMVIPKCEVSHWTYPPDLGKIPLLINVSPGGYPFTSVSSFITNVVNFYLRKTTQILGCEQWSGNPCKCWDGSYVDACDPCPVQTMDGGGFIWDQCDPESGVFLWWSPDKTEQYLDSTLPSPEGLTGHIYKSRVTKDHSQDQEDFIKLYSTWLITHPPYDNRHEDYC